MKGSGAALSLGLLVLLVGCGSPKDVIVPGSGGSGVSTGTGGTPAGSGGVSGVDGGDGGVPNAGPPSCAPGGPGMTNCGAAAENCCTSPALTAGTYYRTYQTGLNRPMVRENPATLSGFRLDKYLVTVGRFRQFVKAWNGGAGYSPPAGAGKHAHLNNGNGLALIGGGFEPGWVAADNSNVAPTDASFAACGSSTWTAAAGTQENLPINCVNWYEAYAFCIWDGGFLPSEAEFGYAEAGGSEQREFPWGDADPGFTNQYAIFNCNYPTGSMSTCKGVASIAPVGSAPLGVGLWGQLDLAGELEVWNLDWAQDFVNPCPDCANFTPATGRILRGASYVEITVPGGREKNYAPSTRIGFVGFRCARRAP